MLNKDTHDYDYSNLVYTYDYSTSTWSALELGDDTVPPRQNIEGVIDNSGIIYIFGGFNATDLINEKGYLYNDMNILNTVSSTWKTLSISGSLPNKCSHYTANILPNGIIVYIGGIEKVSYGVNFTLVDMNKIKLFDTNKLEWSQMGTTGDAIDPRHYFSSVLTPDGYIIIFGGCTYSTASSSFSSVSPKLARLDTNKDTFEWSIPSGSEENSPPSIYGHTANLYHDFMIITFGFNLYTRLLASSARVYLYNIKSNEWFTTFSPTENKQTTTTTGPNKPPTTTSDAKKSSKSLEIVLGVGISATVFIICITVIVGNTKQSVKDKKQTNQNRQTVLCYDPPKRFLHNSVIIDDRLLIFGGYTNVSTYTYELFYLDLSNSFDNNKITWTLIPEGSLPVFTSRSTAILSLDNSTIYLYGGYMRNKDTHYYDFSNLVYTYNYPTSTWSTPKIGGDIVPARQNMKGVIDNSGIIYIFGGYNVTNLENNTGYIYNDMNILNTVSNTWTTLSISGDLPTVCSEYTADILPSGIIVYIGGITEISAYTTGFTPVNINRIKLFDTKKLEWSQMNATGDQIDSRIYFTSVLTPDGYIIIFGGCTYAATNADLSSVSPKLAMLNTNKNPFEWTIPSNSEENSPPSTYGHTANLYNDFMIITFGFNLDTQLYSSSGQVYLYNIKSNKWVTTFDPSPSKPSPSNTSTFFNPVITSPSSKKSSKSLAIGLGTSIGFNLDTQLYSSSGQVYLYNIKSNKWVTTFDPSPSKPSPSNTSTFFNPVITSPSSKKSSKSLAIGLGTSIGVAVLISFIFITIFVYRRTRARRTDQSRQNPDILEVPGSNRNELY
ncbi:hypothetical protein Glove_441g6 [Diversispora epigaea]|uniref:Galactose oxidase n=1 Tax=Diversispora epigaea TaxID=1348612 RepID=A0A397GTB7_9GLOM|nr:hypothetical protein Glove_441g6 [Diversispora epigaea]